ncbi:MAG: response regulator [Syntrophobacterales bacterium]|jgi:DNA-binding response OmpR family regulator|nr:response regulator [Syntrophobacterales bacterium]
MSVILIVDDDKNFLLSLVEGLRAHDNGFEIKTAENGEMAANTIRDESIDLVITDLKMPVTDGFELLAYMSSNYPRIPVIVMTAYGTPLIENSVTNLGAIRYLEKPLDFDLLLEHIYKSIELSESTYAPGIPLATFLKLLNLEKKTCILTVHHDENEGKMFFKRGVLVDAVTARRKSEGAAMEMLSWGQAAIQISTQPFTAEKNIQNDLDFLIMVSQSRTSGQRHQPQTSPAASYDNTPDNIFNMKASDAFDFQNIDAEEWLNQGDFSGGNDHAPPSDGQHQETGSYSNMFAPSENAFSEENEKAAAESSPDADDFPKPPASDYSPSNNESAPPSSMEGQTRGASSDEKETLSPRTDDSFRETGSSDAINTEKMSAALEVLREMMQEGLLCCNICHGQDGRFLMGYNTNPVSSSMSSRVIQDIKTSLRSSELPMPGNTCIIDLEDDKMAVIVILHEYLWSIMMDVSKCPLGLFLNVTLPKVKAIFKEALENQ